MLYFVFGIILGLGIGFFIKNQLSAADDKSLVPGPFRKEVGIKYEEAKMSILAYSQRTSDKENLGVSFKFDDMLAYLSVIQQECKNKFPTEKINLHYYFAVDGADKVTLVVIPAVKYRGEIREFNAIRLQNVQTYGITLNPDLEQYTFLDATGPTFDFMNKGNSIPPPANNRVID